MSTDGELPTTVFGKGNGVHKSTTQPQLYYHSTPVEDTYNYFYYYNYHNPDLNDDGTPITGKRKLLHFLSSYFPHNSKETKENNPTEKNSA